MWAKRGRCRGQTAQRAAAMPACEGRTRRGRPSSTGRGTRTRRCDTGARSGQTRQTPDRYTKRAARKGGGKGPKVPSRDRRGRCSCSRGTNTRPDRARHWRGGAPSRPLPSRSPAETARRAARSPFPSPPSCEHAVDRSTPPLADATRLMRPSPAERLPQPPTAAPMKRPPSHRPPSPRILLHWSTPPPPSSFPPARVLLQPRLGSFSAGRAAPSSALVGGVGMGRGSWAGRGR